MVWFGLHGHLQGGQTPNLRRHPSRHLRTRCNVLRLEFKLVRPPRAKSSEGKGRKGKEGGEREGEPQSEQERGRREGSRPKEAPGQANTQPRTQLRQLATNSRPGGKKTKQRGERQRASRPLAQGTRPRARLGYFVITLRIAQLTRLDAGHWATCTPRLFSWLPEQNITESLWRGALGHVHASAISLSPHA